ncbi:MAG: ABC transporter ATP-binding protein [Luteolibacter sp.]
MNSNESKKKGVFGWLLVRFASMFGMERYLPYYKHLWAVRFQFAIGVVCGLIYAVSSGLGVPMIMQSVFPVLFNHQQLDSHSTHGWQKFLFEHLGHLSPDTLLLITCSWIPLIMLVRGVSSYANSYYINYAGARVLESIRLDLFSKLQRLPLSFYKDNASGDLLARLMMDPNILRGIVTNISADLIKQPATLVSALSLIIYKACTSQSFFVALISLLTVPICVMVIRTSGKKMTKRSKALQNQGGDFNAMVAESLQAPLEIRAYNLEDKQVKMFSAFTSMMVEFGMRIVKYRQAISPAIEVVSSFGFAMAVYFGVKQGMKLTDFMTLFAALFMSYEPLKSLGMIHSQFRQGDAAVDRIEYISDQPETQADPENPKPFVVPSKAIGFRDLTFAYKAEPVLKNINVEIPVGQVVALVGPSGAGKTTFAHLIPRFYDAQQGGIFLDGIDTREFTKKDLRNAIAVVPQMPALFMGTIADNIRIGNEHATDEEVEEAARRAFAHHFIESLPKGYKTEVGERGDLLSGGQRQRIAIARAFLKNAPILILDEATSALDSESEAMVQKALTELVKGRTTFIIAHRYSTITIADRVLVFRNGEIVADGSHEELRNTDPTYQSMIGSQLIGSASGVSS